MGLGTTKGAEVVGKCEHSGRHCFRQSTTHIGFKPALSVGMDRGRMSNLKRYGPRALSEILGELFAARGYGRLRVAGELEQAWDRAVGEPHCHQTRIGEIRHGVLNVTVAHPALLEELAAFRKADLLEVLQTKIPSAMIRDIRFHVGPLDDKNSKTASTLVHDRQLLSPTRGEETANRSPSQSSGGSRTHRNHHGPSEGGK
jgi:hypothetical protein